MRHRVKTGPPPTDNPGYLLLPALSREARDVLSDPRSTAAERDRVWSEHMAEEVFDVITGEIMLLGDLMGHRRDRWVDDARPPHEIRRGRGVEEEGG